MPDDEKQGKTFRYGSKNIVSIILTMYFSFP